MSDKTNIERVLDALKADPFGSNEKLASDCGLEVEQVNSAVRGIYRSAPAFFGQHNKQMKRVVLPFYALGLLTAQRVTLAVEMVMVADRVKRTPQ